MSFYEKEMKTSKCQFNRKKCKEVKVTEKGKAVKDSWMLLKLTAERHCQIFLLCIMKIHHSSYLNAQFKGDYMKMGIAGELWRRQPPFPKGIDWSAVSSADLIYTGLLIVIDHEWYFQMKHILFWDEIGKFMSGEKMRRNGNHAVLEFTVTNRLHS